MRPDVPDPGRGRLLSGIFAFATTLVIGGIAAALLIAGFQARVENSARRDALVIGTSVARALSQQFEKAARFGIPLKLLPGVEVHLSETLAATPGITQIVLRGSDGRELRSAIGELPGTDTTSAPVVVDGNPVASVEVTTSPAALSSSFNDIGVKAAVVVFICAALSALATGFMVGVAIDRSRVLLGRGLARAIEGDFEPPSVPFRRGSATGHGTVGNAFRALAQGNRHVRERRGVFEAYAEELLAVDFDGALRPDVERVRREVFAKAPSGDKGRAN